MQFVNIKNFFHDSIVYNFSQSAFYFAVESDSLEERTAENSENT